MAVGHVFTVRVRCIMIRAYVRHMLFRTIKEVRVTVVVRATVMMKVQLK